ncbi:amino acid adenylation domain-containing protein [Saccharothrix carnea]|uniref:Amino acid adenylation domain-containing protein n=1 Tax=Saccharothrix carnea TaxID=1280637 RepID=A0A2P8IBD2_SACCR|nr:non-ribosomal peptide synthetase [Saccharothrix carnea]PSL55784.1 amino acid adenylation domain-containing protein [Saccharothrix carnea]
MVDKDNIESISGLAAMQKGMLFSHAVDTGSDAYVEQFDFVIAGEVDVEHLRTALAGVSRTYSVLRTIFSYRNTDEPYQIVLKDWAPALDVRDYRDRPELDRDVEEFKVADRAKGFDLSTDVLLRATLIRVGDRRWRLVFTFHHIILDGWSLGPLFGTMMGYYEELTTSGSFQPRHEVLPYRDYIAWYERQRGEDARRYWAEVLDGYENEAVLPADPRPGSYRGATHRFVLPAELHEGLKRFAQEAQVTQSAVFQAAWGVVLQKFNYADDVVFGSVVSGRGTELSGIGEAVGLFANTQPVRVTAGADQDFAGLCRDVQESYLRANAFEHYALHEIQGVTPLKNKLLNHVVAFENYPLSEQLQDFGGDEGDGLAFEGVEVFERTSYDLHIVVNPGAEFAITFAYNENHYAPGLIRELERCLVRVFTAAVDDPRVRVADIALGDGRAEDAPAPQAAPSALLDSSVVDVFADVVASHGDKTALVWRGEEYSYAELDRWSDAVAWELKNRGVVPGTAVGVLADRRPELIAAILGLLKNGNFYVPIDTKDAKPRVEYVVADAGVEHLCTVPEYADKVPSSSRVLLVSRPAGDVPPFPRLRNLNGATAYLMYTSGSTGTPKGCRITHRNILRLVADQEFFDFHDRQVVMFTGSPAFDASTFEIWGTMLFGATLVLADELDVLDGDLMRDTIKRNQVTAMWLTSPLFNQLCAYDPAIFDRLEHLLVGGSALSVQHLVKVRAACPNLRITNGYGPTENTTFSTTHEIRAEDLHRERIPIGRPLAHSSAHVLDRGLNVLPPGAIGELCVGGDGVSSGYHNRPDLDLAAFVTVPALPGHRLYRTGDLVRELPDGTFDYLGRADDQVKISGFRVELGEVESVLRSLDRIEDAAVICVEVDGEKSLRGYYVAREPIAPDAVRQAMLKKVAPYMVPAGLAQLDRIPLNKSGKVDRTRLAEIRPEPEAVRQAPDLGPVSDVVRILFDIIADLVPVETIDVNRNFFDLGINSLNLLTINNRLRKVLDRNVPLVQLFQHTSIASLAAYLDSTGSDDEAGSQADESAPDDTSAEQEEEEERAFSASALLLEIADEIAEELAAELEEEL